jgi:hypothetical protein
MRSAPRARTKAIARMAADAADAGVAAESAPRPRRARIARAASRGAGRTRSSSTRAIEEQRVAVVEDGRIVDFQMTVRTENSVVNDIYRGRVVNLEPAIGAAFVDFGQGRNGFLHTSDVLSIYGEKDWSLDKLLTTSLDPEEFESGSEKSEGEARGEDAQGDAESEAG